MSDSDYEPISQPNSTINGFPSFCQVQLVTKGLEKNPFPREDFYRQFSVTPERQTPESQRTPHWSIPDPEDYREAAEGAEEAAESLKRFYGGRVLLREDPDGSMICGHDSAHWRSKATGWLDEIQRLQELYEKRIEQEQRGEAEKGHAQALFSSPLQSPSPPHSDCTLLANVAGIKKRKPAAARSFQQVVTKSPSHHPKKRSQLPQLTPDDNPNSISKAPKRRKHTVVAKGQEVEQKSSTQASFGTRPPRQMTDPIPKDRPHLVTESALGPRINTSRVSKTTTKKMRRQKKMHLRGPQAPRVLPWTLRSRDAISYRETGTRAASKKKRRPG